MCTEKLEIIDLTVKEFCRSVVFCTQGELAKGEISKIYFHGSPFQLCMDYNEEAQSLYSYIHFRAFGLGGDKTDYHEIVSSFFAIIFRAFDCSPELIRCEWDILPGEVYECFMYFAKQPNLTFKDIEKVDVEDINYLLVMFYNVCLLNAAMFSDLQEGKGESDYAYECDDWAESTEHFLKNEFDDLSFEYRNRCFPSWKLLLFKNKLIDGFISKFEFDLGEVLAGYRDENYNLIKDTSGWFVVNEKVKNFIPDVAIEAILNFMKFSNATKKELLVIPTETDVFAVCNSHFLRLNFSCGHDQYLVASTILKEKYQAIGKWILPSLNIKWEKKINPYRFEDLVRELLNHEPGVLRVRKIGKGNEGDFGRDLLMDRTVMSTFIDKNGHSSKKPEIESIVVQCKAYSKSVNKRDVQDIRDTVAHHNAQGFFLVSISSLTVPLISTLEKIDTEGHISCDWWTKPEIEDALNRNRGLASRFGDILRVSEE